MRKRSIIIGTAGLLVACMLAWSCGGTSSSDKTASAVAGRAASPASAATSGTTPAASGSAAASSPPAGGGTAITVTARDFELGPDEIAASKGETLNIMFSNQGGTAHTFSVFSDEAYTTPFPGADTGQVAAGDTKQLSLTVPADSGDSYFRCNIHPAQMKGEISIEE